MNLLKINGHEITEIKEILKEYYRFYRTLYQYKPKEHSKINFFDTPISTLSPEDSLVSAGPRNEQQCEEALMQMQNNKSPGSDGLNAEFYRTFWSELKVY